MTTVFATERYKGSTALIDDLGNEISYDELWELGKEIIAKIKGRSLVFSICSNTIGAIVGYTAFLDHGIVPLLLSKDLDLALLWNLVDTYKPDHIWAPSDMDLSGHELNEDLSIQGYTLYDTPYDHEYELHEELCLLLTTSGSTGSSKLVRQTYKNVISNAEAIKDYLELSSDERAITTLPMNYTYGLSILNSHLICGATILLTEKGVQWKEFWEFFEKERATSFGGVPFTYEILDKLGFWKRELPSLRYMTQSGGKLRPELHKKYAKYAEAKGIRFIAMYGATEATARMTYLPAELAKQKYGSVGIAIPGGKLRLIDEVGKEIREAGVAGELIYEGPGVTLGYAVCGEDLAKEDENHGVLATGDMARFDEDGCYYIVGRKKRFLKIFGSRVSLDEVEALLGEAFSDMGIACAGRDDELTIFTDKDGCEKELRGYISKKTGINPSAFKVVYMEEIPRSDSGKILYKKLEGLID